MPNHGPFLPDIYLKVITHPHSVNSEVKIIPLTGQSTSLESIKYVPEPVSKSWAPFWTLSDFEYTETAIQGLLSKDLVDKQLAGFYKGWHTGESHLTIHNYGDMQKSLCKAQAYILQVNFFQLSICMFNALLHSKLVQAQQSDFHV